MGARAALNWRRSVVHVRCWANGSDHLPNSRARIDHQALNVLVCSCPNPENFVGEGLTDCLNTREIENDGSEPFNPRECPLGLGARDQFLLPEPRYPQRNYRLREVVIVP